MSCLSRLWQSGKRKLLNRPSKKFQKFISSGLTLADLRHTCASLLLKNGVSMKEIQEWLGHSNFSTTANIYAHLDTASKNTPATRMSQSFSISPGIRPNL